MMHIELASTIKLVVFDFDGVFTDNTVVIDQNGIESVKCCRSDGLGISNLFSMGIEVRIVSTEINPVVSTRANKLKIPCMQGVEDKSIAIYALAKELNISLDQIAFVGNDINDINALKIVGLPIAVSDAYPEIKKYTLYTTKKSGGYGAVREVCDLICEVKSNKRINS